MAGRKIDPSSVDQIRHLQCYPARKVVLDTLVFHRGLRRRPFAGRQGGFNTEATATLNLHVSHRLWLRKLLSIPGVVSRAVSRLTARIAVLTPEGHDEQVFDRNELIGLSQLALLINEQ